MLGPKRGLCVAPGGSGSPIPFLRAMASEMLGWDEGTGHQVEPRNTVGLASDVCWTELVLWNVRLPASCACIDPATCLADTDSSQK